eukprot:4712009-Alexandrium_andersonii.AAC.1
MASVRPHSMRKFLTTEAAWPVKVFPGRSAAADSPVVTSTPVRIAMPSCATNFGKAKSNRTTGKCDLEL